MFTSLLDDECLERSLRHFPQYKVGLDEGNDGGTTRLESDDENYQ